YVDKQRLKPISFNREIEHTTSSLNCLMEYIPYSHLRRYIESFPYKFDSYIDGPGNMWEIYKRDNPMIYPFPDNILNQRMDDFFDCQNRVEYLLNAYYSYRDRNNRSYRCMCFITNNDGSKLSLNYLLTPEHKKNLEEETQQLKTKYLNTYNALTEYIRNNYPNVNLNQYRF
uniref:hypothetical protein n=1 Tax=Photobacterium phosphoreum TaxID=659 RepID=UPI0039AF9641